MTESSKGALQRIKDKVADTVGEQIGVWLLAFVSLIVVPALVAWLTPARHWIANEWACIQKPWCEVRGWSLGALILVTAAAAVTAIYLGLRLYGTRRRLQAATIKNEPAGRSSFRQITVEDQRLNLRWFIRRPPSEWLPWRDVASTITPAYVRETLDGPFHAVPGCNAPLGEKWGQLNSAPLLSPECPTCGQIIFRPCRLESGFGDEPVNAYHVRAQALEELQRMERNGVTLDADARLVLEKPGYWKLMQPPSRWVLPQK